jgi:hypothetical protein
LIVSSLLILFGNLFYVLGRRRSRR